jgi:hypothetical protein
VDDAVVHRAIRAVAAIGRVISPALVLRPDLDSARRLGFEEDAVNHCRIVDGSRDASFLFAWVASASVQLTNLSQVGHLGQGEADNNHLVFIL